MREYDLIAVEVHDVKRMLEFPKNSQNTASSAWVTFKRMPEYKCEREGTHFVAVEPDGTNNSVHFVTWKPTNRCGCAKIPAPRVASRLIVWECGVEHLFSQSL
jgi:transposase